MLAPSPSGDPVIWHWGAALGTPDDAALAGLVTSHRPGVPHSALDEPRNRGVVSENVSGFTGRPGLEGLRPGRTAGAWAPRLRDWTWDVSDDGPDATVLLTGRDAEAGWQVDVEVELTREGLVRLRTRVTNIADDDLVLQAVRGALPVAAARPRAPRPHRALVPRADPAAPRLAEGHPPAREPARPHRTRREPRPGRRCARLRVRARRGLGHPPRVER